MAAAVALLVAVTACGGGGDAPPPPTGGPAAGDPLATATVAAGGADQLMTADGLVGPLCPVLPAGDEPGNPTFLRDLDHHEALTWIPIATIVESLARGSGQDQVLRTASDVTVLVPSDDTITGVYGDATIDALILDRSDEAAALLDAHIIDRPLSLAGLVEEGVVTTRAGTTITITGPPTAPVFDGDAGLLCGDYGTAGGVIHVIGGILGPKPTPEPDDGHDDHDTVG